MNIHEWSTNKSPNKDTPMKYNIYLDLPTAEECSRITGKNPSTSSTSSRDSFLHDGGNFDEDESISDNNCNLEAIEFLPLQPVDS